MILLRSDACTHLVVDVDCVEIYAVVEISCVEVYLLDGMLYLAVGMGVSDFVDESDQLDYVTSTDKNDDENVIDFEDLAIVFAGVVV